MIPMATKGIGLPGMTMSDRLLSSEPAEGQNGDLIWDSKKD
jgi:hypothetical protein